MQWYSDDAPTPGGFPAAGPTYRQYFAWAVRNGEMWFLGGGVNGGSTPMTLVEKYTIATNTWSTETPLTTALLGRFSQSRGVFIGDWVYLIAGTSDAAEDQGFYRWNVDTGTLQSLSTYSSPTFSGGDLALVDGLIYHRLGRADPQVYDPGAGTWSAAAGTDQGGSARYSVAEYGDGVLVTPNSTVSDREKFLWYEPGVGFTALPNLPHDDSVDNQLLVAEGLVYVFMRTASPQAGKLYVIDLEADTPAWEYLSDQPQRWGNNYTVPRAAGEYESIPVLVYAGPLGGFVSRAQVYVYGELVPPLGAQWSAVADLSASANVQMLASAHLAASAALTVTATVSKGPSATLPVAVNVEYPFETQDAFLTVTVDVTGGPGEHTDLLVAFTTGRITSTPLAVTIDVTEDSEAVVMLEPSEASEDPEVVHAVVYGGPATELLEREVSGCDSYGFDWPAGGALTGSATMYGEDGDPQPDLDLPVDSDGELSLSWELHGDIVATREFDSDTLTLLNTVALDELVPMYNQAGDDPDCLYDLTATLCSDADLVTRCAIIGLLPSVLPTRAELCVAACAEAGVSLFITPGPGIPGMDWLVGHDYRTRGKSPLTVVQELLLDGGAPMWASPGALFVSGAGLPEAGLLTADRDVLNGESRTEQTAYPDDEPVLSDFTRHCGTEVDPCNGDTFETMPTATLEWVEETIPAAPSFMPTRIEHRVVKESGRITLEEATHFGPYREPVGSGSQWAWGWVQTVRTEYAYLNCCPEALSFTEETVHVRRTLDQAPGFSEAGYLSTEALTWFRAMPETYLHSYKSVQQTWHAEGWLRSRIESTKTFDGWQFQGDVWSEGSIVSAAPTYSEAGHEQQYVPIGQGLWHVHTQNRDTILVPFREIDPTAATVDIVGSNRTRATAAFTVVTDAAPPTVTCSPVCGPEGTCLELAEAEFDAAHARWEALRAAQLLNEPEAKRVVTKVYQGRRHSLLAGLTFVPLHPGAMHSDGMVARVSWAGQGPRTGTPGETTTVEYWSAVTGS